MSDDMCESKVVRRFVGADGKPYQRYVIVGTSGSGKTTLASRLSTQLGYPHVELDQIHWQPGWEPRPLEEFRAMVSSRVEESCWVVDGNYSKVRDIVWARAQAVIWLDLPFYTVMWQLLGRTLDRVIGRREPFDGCRETWGKTFASRESILWWAAKTWWRRRSEYPQLFEQSRYSHLDVFRVTDSEGLLSG